MSVYGKYIPTIGLEIHCRLNTKTKLFCSCSNSFGKEPNANTCEVCLGLPGSLPKLNIHAVEKAILFACAVQGKIQPTSVFSRKQYFYPDLPKGYQITQFKYPYCLGGRLEVEKGLSVELERVHMEEDAGKNIHMESQSAVDLNRAGSPLIEIVSKPQIDSPAKAAKVFKFIYDTVRFLEICDGNLEEGSLRCDVNVSIRPQEQTTLGTRTEVKNINSFRNVEKAAHYEILRHIDLVSHGEKIVQQTVGYDASTGKTFVQRDKEDSDDYRYFPDPDIRKLKIASNWVEKLESSMPILPNQMGALLREKHSVQEEFAKILTQKKELLEYFFEVRKVCKPGVKSAKIASWLCTEFLKEQKGDESRKVNATSFGELMWLLESEEISIPSAKKALQWMFQSDLSVREIIEKYSLKQVSDPNEVEKIISKVLKLETKALAEYKAGNKKAFGFLMGQIMKAGGGTLDPGVVSSQLKKAVE